MNKSFKVLWNKHRAQHVVTDEHKAAHGKEKSKTLLSATTLSFVAMGSSLALLFSTPTWAADPVAPVVQNITPRDGWTQTHITSSGNVTNITTDAIANSTGINKFKNFQVADRNIANLQLGSASRLLNFVDNEVQIAGVVNAVKNAKIGGDLYFLTPSGFVVGKTGVVNATRLNALVLTQKAYDEYVGKSTDEVTSNENLTAFQTAEVPLNPEGVITINGSVNVGNEALLAAANIAVGEGAKIQSGVADFSQLVNIAADNKGNAAVNAGIADMTMTVDSQSGDILLVARADGSQTAIGQDSNNLASLKDGMPWNEWNYNQNDDDDPPTNTVTATISVGKNALISAAKSAKLEAAAGAGAYVAKSRLSADGTSFGKSQLANPETITATVQVEGSVIAKKDAEIHALADNKLDHTAGFNMEGIKRVFGGSLYNLDSGVENVNNQTTAAVTLSKDAVVRATGEATDGGHVKITSDSVNNVVVGNASTWATFVEYFDSDAPIMSGIVASVASHSNVDVEGTVEAKKAIDVEANNTLNANLSAEAATANNDGFQSAFVNATLNSDATTTIGSTAHLRKTEGTNALESLTVGSSQRGKVITLADTTIPGIGRKGLSVNITKLETNAQTNFAPAEAISGVDAVKIDAQNITDSLQVTSKVDVGDNTFAMKFKANVAKALNPKLITQALTSSMFGSAATGEQNPSKLAAGGSLAYIENTQHATVNVGQSVHANNTLAIGSTSRLDDHRYQSSAKQVIDSESEAKVTGALAILIDQSNSKESANVSSNVIVGDGLTLEAGQVSLTNLALVNENRWPELKSELTSALDALDLALARDTVAGQKIRDGAQKIRAAMRTQATMSMKGGLDTADTVSKDLHDGFTELIDGLKDYIKDGGKIGSAVYQLGLSLLNIVNPASYANAWVSAGSKTSDAQQTVTDASGSFGVVSQDLASRLVLGANSHINATAGTAVVLGQSYNGSVALGGKLNSFLGVPLPEMTSGNSIGGNFIYQSLGTNNLVMLREGSSITSTGDLHVKAEDQVKGYSVTAGMGINSGSKALISGLTTLVRADAHNRLAIDDEASLKSTGGSVVAQATRNDDFVNIAGDLQYGSTGSSSVAVGAGVAVVFGGLENRVNIADNDNEAVSDDSSAVRLSAGDFGIGSIEADGANAVADVSAHQDLDMNTVGVAAMVQKSKQQGQDQGQQGQQGQAQPAQPIGGAGDTPSTESQSTGQHDSVTGEDIKNEMPGFGGTVGMINMLSQLIPEDSEFGQGVGKVNHFLQSDAVTKITRLFTTMKNMSSAVGEMAKQNEVTEGNVGGKANSVFGSDASSLQTKTEFDGKANINTGSTSNQQAGGGFKITGAGSVAWNDFDTTNEVTVRPASGHYTIGAKKTVNVVADIDRWQAAWAGAGALGLSKGSNDSFAATIAGAVAVNKGTSANTITVNGLAITNGLNGTNPVNTNVYSTTHGSLVAEGLGLSVVNGGKTALGLTAGVSYNDYTNNVTAAVEHLTMAPTVNGNTYQQTAWAGDTQVTGGTGIGVATGTNNSAAAGGTVAIANLTNTIQSTLANSTLTHMQTVGVSALNSLTQVTTSIGVQVAKGASGALALDGSYAGGTLTNTLTASADNTTLDMLEGGEVTVESHDDAASKVTGDLDAINALVPELVEDSPLPNGARAFVSSHDQANVGKYDTAIGDYTYEVDQDKTSKSLRSLYQNANMRQITVALGIAGSSSKNGGAGSAAIILNNINNTFNATSDHLTVNHGKLTQTGKSGVATVDVAMGVAGSSGQFTAAGSVIVEKITQTTNTAAVGLKSGAATNSLGAENTALSAAVAGNLAISVGKNSGALGAAVVVNEVHNNASVSDTGSTYSAAGGHVSDVATNDSQSLTGAINGSVAGNAAIGGSVAIARTRNNATATMTNAVLSGALADLAVTANDTAKNQTLSGALSISTDVKKSASLGGAVSYVSLTGETAATINGLDSQVGAPNVSVLANAHEVAKTLSVAGSFASVSIAGAVGLNNIERTVHATLAGLKSTTDAMTAMRFGDVSVLATNTSQIGNLALVPTVGIVGIGAGVSKNWIGDKTLVDVAGNTASMKSLNAVAHSDADIDTIGIGIGAGSSEAATGSVTLNKITGKTETTADNNTLQLLNAGVFNAVSNNTFGVYTGGLAVGGSGAYGVSVATVDNQMTTATNLLGTNAITQSGGTGTLSALSAVDDSNINHDIVPAGSLSTAANLGDHVVSQTVNGLYVGASSLSAYKNFLLNVSASGMNLAAAGTLSFVTHGGNTAVTVDGGTLSGNSVRVHAGDYANNTMVLASAGVSTQDAVGLLFAQNSSAHATALSVKNSTLGGSTVATEAEGKEGLSTLLIQVDGGLSGAASVVGGVNKTTSSVTSTVENSTLGSVGGTTSTTSHYLHRLNDLGVSVGLSVNGPAGAASVFVNKADNVVAIFANNARYLGNTVTVDANRTLDWDLRSGTVAVSANSIAASATVGVNTIEGNTLTSIVNSPDFTTDDTNQLNISSTNNDDVQFTYVTAGLSLASPAVAASVIVNKVKDNATIDVNTSKLLAKNLVLDAHQSRTLGGKVWATALSASWGIGANVFVNTVGENTSNYDDLLSLVSNNDDKGDKTTKWDALKTKITSADALDSDTNTANTAVKSVHGLSSEEAAAVVAGNRATIANAVLNERTHLGTRVNVVNSTVAASQSAKILAQEDPVLNGVTSGLTMTVGNIDVGLGASLGASVAIAKRYVMTDVDIDNSSITTPNGTLLVGDASVDNLHAIQGNGGLVSGGAVFAKYTVTGNSTLSLTNNSTLSGFAVDVKHGANQTVFAEGYTAGGVVVGAMVARALDSVNTKATIANSTLTSSSVIAERAQTFTGKATAGFGGAVAGVGADVRLDDTGASSLTFTNSVVSGTSSDAIQILADNHPTLTVTGGADGGGIVGVGVVLAKINEAGSASLSYTGGEITAPNVTLGAVDGKEVSGSEDDKEAAALTMKGDIHGYGGGVVDVNFNRLTLTNLATSTVSLSGIGFDANTALTTLGGGYTFLKGEGSAKYGGAVTSGSNEFLTTNGLTSSMTLTGLAGTTLQSLNAKVNNGAYTSVYGEAAGGALVDFSLDAIRIVNQDLSHAALDVAGHWTTTGAFNVAATTDVAKTYLTADNTKGGLGALSGVVVENYQGTASQAAPTTVTIDDGAVVNAGGNIGLSASTNWGLKPVDGHDKIVTSEVYGAIAGSGVHSTYVMNRTNDVVVGNASLTAGGDIAGWTKSTGDVNVYTIAHTAAGAAGIAGIMDDAFTVHDRVTLRNGALLKTTSLGSTVAISSSTNDNVIQNAASRFEGAVAAVVTTLNSTFNRNTLVDVQEGATIDAAGSVDLGAGETVGNEESNLRMDTFAMSYAGALLAVAKPVLHASNVLSDHVNIDGNVYSTKSASVTADSGFYKIAEETDKRYWASVTGSGDVKMSVKGVESKLNNVTEDGVIHVGGTLTAGRLTQAKITVREGIYVPNGSDDGSLSVSGSTLPIARNALDLVDIDVGSDDPDLINRVKSTIGALKSESINNIYAARLTYLKEAIRTYSMMGHLSQDQSNALLAFQNEYASLKQMLLDEGLATEKNGVLTVMTGESDVFLPISGLTVSGGSIALKAGNVTGAGTINANAAKGIEVVNHSNASLDIGNFSIAEKGGTLTLNNTEMTNASLRQGTKFTGTLNYAGNASNPAIKVTTSWKGGEFTLTNTVGGQSASTTYDPTTHMVVSGALRNDVGDLSLNVQGDIYNGAAGSMNVAGSMTLTSGGAITQTSSTPGAIINTGGAPEGMTFSDDSWNNVINTVRNALESTGKYTASGDKGGSAWVASGQIFIAGSIINVNGLLQSGYGNYYWQADSSNSAVMNRIAQIRQAWIDGGRQTIVNAKTSAYLINGEYNAQTGSSYTHVLSAWYNPSTNTILLDDVSPKPTGVFLTGRIASTGGGNILVSNGTPNVQIDTSGLGDMAVRLGTTIASTSAGSIQITDTNYYSKDDDIGAKVTRYDAGTGKYQTWNVDTHGNVKGTVADLTTLAYTPMSQWYVWTEGKGTMTRSWEQYYAKKGLWGLWWPSIKEMTKENSKSEDAIASLSSKATISTTFDPGASGDLVAWNTKLDGWDSGWSEDRRTWSSGAFGWYKNVSVYRERTTGNTSVKTFAINAGHTIGIGSLGGTGNISVKATGNVELAGAVRGASLSNVSLTSTNGSIKAVTDTAALEGGHNFTLKADHGSIGEAGRALALKGGSAEKITSGDKETYFKVDAGEGVYLDGTHRNTEGFDRTVFWNLNAGGDVALTMPGSVRIFNMSGENITVNSTGAGTTFSIGSLTQKANAAQTQQFNANVGGSLSVTVVNGSLGLGTIVAGGDVSLDVQHGSIYDARVLSDTDMVSTDTDNARIEAWKRAGLIDENGDTLGGQTQLTKDIATEEESVLAQFKQYRTMAEMSETDRTALPASMKAVYQKLATRFNGLSLTATDRQVLDHEVQDTSSRLAVLKSSTTKYYGWTQDQLLYSLADSIVNAASGTQAHVNGVNIQAGGNVRLNSSTAGIGSLGTTVSGNIFTGTRDERIAVINALSQADVGDFTATPQGLFTVNLKRPVVFSNGGSLTVSAKGNVYLTSPDVARVADIETTGDVRLIANQGIEAVQGTLRQVIAKTITLRGGSGGIGEGTAGQADSGGYLKVKTDPNGWVALSGTKDIFVSSGDNDFTLYALASDASVNLQAKNLYSYRGDGDSVSSDFIDFSRDGIIKGDNLNLFVKGNLGAEGTPFRVDVASKLHFNGYHMGNLYLEGVNKGAGGTLMVDNVWADGIMEITSADKLLLGSEGPNSRFMSGANAKITAESDIIFNHGFYGTSTSDSDETWFTSNHGNIYLSKYYLGGQSLNFKAVNGNIEVLDDNNQKTSTDRAAVELINVHSMEAKNILLGAGSLTKHPVDNVGVNTAQGSILDVRADFTLKATNDLDIHNMKFSDVATNEQVTGLLSVGGNLIADHGTFIVNHPTTLSVAGDMDFHGAELSSNYLITVTAQKGVNLSDASLNGNWTWNALNEGYTIDASGLVLKGIVGLTMNTWGDLDLSSVTQDSAIGGSLDAPITVDPILNTFHLSSTTGKIDLHEASFNAVNDVYLNTTKSINLKGATISGGRLVDKIDEHADGGFTWVKPTVDIDATNATLTFNTLTLNTTGALKLAGASLTGKKALVIDRPEGDLDLTKATLKGGSITVTAPNIVAKGLTVESHYTGSSNPNDVIPGAVSITTGNLDLGPATDNTVSHITAKTATLTATGDLQAAGILLDGVEGDPDPVYHTPTYGGTITLSRGIATGTWDMSGLKIGQTTTVDVTVTSPSNINAQKALIHAGSLTVNGAKDIDATGYQMDNGNLTVHAGNNLTLAQGTIGTGKLIANAGNQLDVRGISVTQSGSVSLIAGGDLNLSSALSSLSGGMQGSSFKKLTGFSATAGGNLYADDMSVQVSDQTTEFNLSAKKELHANNFTVTQDGEGTHTVAVTLLSGDPDDTQSVGKVFADNLHVEAGSLGVQALNGTVAMQNATVDVARTLLVQGYKGIDMSSSAAGKGVYNVGYVDGAPSGIYVDTGDVNLSGSSITYHGLEWMAGRHTLDMRTSRYEDYLFDITAAHGNVKMEGTTLTVAQDWDKQLFVDTVVKASGDILGKDSKIVDTDQLVSLTAGGKVDLSQTAASTTPSIQAGKLAIEAGGDVLAQNANWVVESTPKTDYTERNSPEEQAATAATPIVSDITVTSTAGKIAASDATMTAIAHSGGETDTVSRTNVTLTGKTDVDFSQAHITGHTLTATAQTGALKAANAVLDLDESMAFTSGAAMDLSHDTLSGKTLSYSAAGDVTLDGSTVTSSVGDVTIASTVGNVSMAGTSITSAKDVNVSAAKAIAGKNVQIAATAGNATVNAGTSLSMTADTAGTKSVTAKSVTITAADALTLDKMTVAASTGAALVKSTGAGKTVSVDGAQITGATTTTVTSAGDLHAADATLKGTGVSATGTSSVNADGATMTATNGDVSLKSTAGDVSATGATLSGTGAATLDAAKVLSATNAQVSGHTAALTGNSVTANGATIASATDAAVTARTGDVAFSNATLTGTTGELHAAGSLTAQNLATTLSDTVQLTSGGAMDLTSTDATKVLSAKSISAEAAGNVTANGTTLTATNGDVSVKSTAGDVSATGVKLSGTGAATLDAAKVLTATNAQVAGHTAALTGNSVTANGAKIASATDAAVTARTGDVAFSNASISGTTGELHATGSLTAQNLAATLSDAAQLTSGGAMDLTSTDATKVLSAKSISAEAAGNVTANGTTLTAMNGDVALKSTAGDVSATGAKLSGTGAATLDAAHSLTATNAQVSGHTTALTGDSVSANGAQIASATDATVTARTGDVAFSNATISGTTGELHAAGNLTAQNLAATLSDAAQLTSGGAMDLSSTDASKILSAKSINAEAAGNVTANGTTLTATNGDVALKSTAGDVSATGAKLSGTGAATLDAAKVLTATNAQVSGHTAALTGNRVTANGATIASATDAAVTARTGDVAFSNATLTGTTGELHAAGSLTAQNLAVTLSDAVQLTSGGAMDLTSTDATKVLSAKSIDAQAAGNVTANGTTLTATNGDVSLKSTAGDVSASGAHLGSTGATALTAAGAMSLDNAQLNAGTQVTATATNALDANGATMKGTAVALTGASVSATNAELQATTAGVGLTSTSGDMALSGAQITGATNAELTSAGALSLGNARVNATQQVAMTSTGALSADGAAVAASDVALTGSSVNANNMALQAANGADIIGATGGVTLGGNSRLLAKSVTVAANAGDIALDGNVVMGDEHLTDHQADVTLTAAGNIRQTAGNADTGLRGRTLTATAGGATTLGAMPSATSEGNSFSDVTVDSGSDVAFATNGTETTLSINAARDGQVNGNLSVNGPAGAVKLANALTVAGNAAVNAKRISGSDLTATGKAQLTTALYDNSTEDGVRMTGKVQGSEVLLYTNAGTVNTGDIQSTSGQTSVYRQSQAVAGDIDISRIDSATKAVVYNGNGNIHVGGGSAQDNFSLVTGVAGTAGDRAAITSASGTVSVFPNGAQLFAALDANRIINGAAAIDTGVALPGTASEAATLSSATVGVVPQSMDFRSPTSTYFSLASRTDAALMSIPVTTEVDSDVATPVKALDIATEARAEEQRAEATTNGDEETTVRSPLDWMVVPKDHQGQDIIRDLRPLPQPDNLNWLVSLNSDNQPLNTSVTPSGLVSSNSGSSNTQGQ